MSVVSINDESAILEAPLLPNINHRETVFGGSASALAILSAWALLHTRMMKEIANCGLVIQQSTMDYKKPIRGTFQAHATLDQPGQWGNFLKSLRRRGKARLDVSSVLECAGEVVGKLHGRFVALADTAKGSRRDEKSRE